MPDDYDAAHAAPLLCAGLSGYRVYVLAGAGRRLGLYGFGAAAHLLAQVALAQGREVYAFTRPFNRPGDQCSSAARCRWALPGLATATPTRPCRSMPPSSLHRMTRLCRPR